ncbi:MAG TPA: tetraacyldisaccharide 4'-kinase, partial [Gemmatimonadaceae bacterium]|nr:tetraacyldisaccharide 4'-kinase [Gemmatimonadaceae bacterium]
GWTTRQRVLPAGPFREPLSALRRASAVFVTRKSPSSRHVTEAQNAITLAAPGVPVSVLRLSLSNLAEVRDVNHTEPVATLSGRKTLAVAAVGNPDAFFRQLEELGALVVPMPYPDHHHFSEQDVAAMVSKSAGCDYVVCTLKDAVKLERLWPAARIPLWYVSLAVEVESGAASIEGLLMRLKGRIRSTEP